MLAVVMYVDVVNDELEVMIDKPYVLSLKNSKQKCGAKGEYNSAKVNGN